MRSARFMPIMLGDAPSARPVRRPEKTLSPMQLQALHHVTMITGDAQANVAFYADLLGLRLVKKTVNFDAPEAYHLYFADEQGTPGSILTWFEFPGVPQGAAGAGMIHRLQLGVGGDAGARVLEGPPRRGRLPVHRDPTAGCASPTTTASRSSCRATRTSNPPLTAQHPDIPDEFAIQGVQGARAYAADPDVGARRCSSTCSASTTSATTSTCSAPATATCTGATTQSAERGREGAGTVHHIAWHSLDDDHAAWQAAGARGRPARHRRSSTATTSSRSTSAPRQGILFEIATTSPGFAVDEDPAHLGEALRLPAQHEHLREHLERVADPAAQPARLTLTYRERPADGDPAGLLVLHHGRGADEHDLLGLADVLDPERRLHVVTPRAPLELPGWPGRHWYVVPRVGYPDHDTFHAARAALAELPRPAVGDAPASTPETTVLGGFSMGSVMSYTMAFDPDRPTVAGVLAFSGFMPIVDDWAPDLPPGDARLRRPRPRRTRSWRSASPAARASCSRPAASTVDYHESDAAHHIDPQHLPAAVGWLSGRYAG